LVAEAGHPSRLVDRLVEAGLVERRTAGEDRRRVELALTAKGRRLERRAVAVRGEVMDFARAIIGDRDIEPVLELLREFVGHTAYRDLLTRRRALN
jgi:DNA-binding MarR family transcriptional regulator